jgi:2-methylcitrate dehydratase PrpD
MVILNTLKLDSYACAHFRASRFNGRHAAAEESVGGSMAARLSVHCVAVALVDGVVKQGQFHPGRLPDPRVSAVLEKVEIVAVPELPARYPEKSPHASRSSCRMAPSTKRKWIIRKEIR